MEIGKYMYTMYKINHESFEPRLKNKDTENNLKVQSKIL